jgi:PKHD-type hydroxylase
MIHTIDLLNEEQVSNILDYYEISDFVDGSVSGTDDKNIKNNLEMLDPAHYNTLRKYFDECVDNCLHLKYLFSPKGFTNPLFVKYEPGMHYNYHYDLYVMDGIKSDYSVTCFLNSPDEYEGGELIIKVGGKELEYKLQPGQAVIYPTGLEHKVNKIVSGSRKVVVFWMESLIHDSRIRSIITEYCEILYKNKEILGEKVYDFENIKFKLVREYGIF